MTIDEVIALVDRDTSGYRRNDQYELPAGKVRSIVEVAYLAGEANSRNSPVFFEAAEKLYLSRVYLSR